MDLNDLRSLVTVALFVVFVAIVAWAWSGRRRASFEAAAHLPLQGDDIGHAAAPARRANGANT